MASGSAAVATPPVQDKAFSSVQAEPDASGPQGLRRLQGFVYSGLALALGITLLYLGRPVLLPLAFAALLAFVLNPLVNFLQSLRLPRALAVAASVALAVGVMGVATLLAAQQVLSLSAELPAYRSNFHAKLISLRPALSQPGAFRELSRMLGMVETEIDAAREALDTHAQPKGRTPTKVWVEAAPPTALRALAGWVKPVITPLATAGLVVVLLSFMLMQRTEMLDRFVKLMGADLHLISDALAESARRVSRYLFAQLLVNIGYGLPLALGLWWLGVPGAWLWGGLATVLRFVPYLGPALAAVFPLIFAFAIDPGWSMVIGVIVWSLALELLINNIVEPLAYGGSTGVSPLAVLLSAAFWALLWGPVGLVVATPLTVCLVVIGQHLKPMRFLGMLLSSEPAFNPPEKLYRRLISGDQVEAGRLCTTLAREHGPSPFYALAGLPMLALAAQTPTSHAKANHRYRVLTGTAKLLEGLQAHPTEVSPGHPEVLCIGVRDELDTLSADMVAHALRLVGIPARARPLLALTQGEPAMLQTQKVWLCTFDPAPQAVARLLVRRLRRAGFQGALGMMAWQAPMSLTWPGAAATLGLDQVLTRLQDLPVQGQLAPVSPLAGPPTAPAAATSDPMNWDPVLRLLQRVQWVFAVPLVTLLVRLPDGQWRHFCAGVRAWATPAADRPPTPGSPLDHVLSTGEPLVLMDSAQDPRFSGWREAQFEGLNQVAAWPVRHGQEPPLGVLAVHDRAGRVMSGEALALMQLMAQDTCLALRPLLCPPGTQPRPKPRALQRLLTRFSPRATGGH